MKKYSKLIVAAIVALIFIGTFVFLYEKSQPKPVEYTEFTPKMADVLKTTVITGKIEPRNEVSVAVSSPRFAKKRVIMFRRARLSPR